MEDTEDKEEVKKAVAEIDDDVEIEDLSAKQVTVAVQGPSSAEVLSGAGLSPLPEKDLQHQEVTLAEASIRIVSSNQTYFY